MKNCYINTVKILIKFILFWKPITSQNTQRFAIEPNNQTAVVGDQVILGCRVINKGGQLQWTRDGFGLGIERNLNGFSRYTMVGNDDQGDYSLQINSVTLEDDATFQCQVSTSDGIPGIRSKSALITVLVAPEPPVIVQARAQGDWLRTTTGTTIELSCESHGGKPSAELQWIYSDGTAILAKNITVVSTQLSDGKRYNSQSKWIFIASKDFDNKTIICRSNSSALRQPLKASIRLDVKYAPEVQLKIMETDRQIKVGDSVEFVCEANGNPNQLLYKWFRNDEIIIGDHSTRLVLAQVDKQLNGAVISCEVSNTVGSNKAIHTLNIAFGPILKAVEDPVYGVDLGKDVVLKCEVEGNPKPDITWLKLGSNNVLHTESEFTIKAITRERIGSYVCRASVKGFPEISSQSIVCFNGPPLIHEPYTYYGLNGKTIRIECYIESVPKPTQIVWYYDSRTMNIDINRGVDIIEDRIAGESTLRSTLIIHNSKFVNIIEKYRACSSDKSMLQADFGDYNCSVWNSHGFDSKIITIVEKMSFAFMVTIAGLLLFLLVLIVLTTIISILYLRYKRNRDSVNEKKKSKIALSSSESEKGSTDSLTSNGSDDSEVEMQSMISSVQSAVNRHYNHINRTDFMFDLNPNQTYRQYI